ncbi:hypothetical protein PHSC3_000512 [Chlamydiales bacterium STE3]|nr:hypothetical protein PHSC3_000512 [Chlamydiales bacterium STE3]
MGIEGLFQPSDHLPIQSQPKPESNLPISSKQNLSTAQLVQRILSPAEESVVPGQKEVIHEAENIVKEIETSVKEFDQLSQSQNDPETLREESLLDSFLQDVPYAVESDEQKKMVDSMLGLQEVEEASLPGEEATASVKASRLSQGVFPQAETDNDEAVTPLLDSQNFVHFNEKGRLSDNDESENGSLLDFEEIDFNDSESKKDAVTFREEPRNSMTVVDRKRSLGFKIWRLLSRLTALLSHDKTKFLSKIVVKFGLVRIEEMEPDMIARLSSTLMSRVSQDQFSKLKPEHFDKMDFSQLFAIGPDRLSEIGPKNMAHVIKNRLDLEAARSFFILEIAEKSFEEKSQNKLVRDLFSELGPDITRRFLKDLQKTSTEKFAYFYKTLLGREKLVQENYIQSLLDGSEESFKEDPTHRVDIGDGQNAVGFNPLEIFWKDAERENTYIFNGQQVDPDISGQEKTHQVLEMLYETTGRDAALTQNLQFLLNQGALAKFQRYITERYSLGLIPLPGTPYKENDDPSVGTGTEQTVYSLNIDQGKGIINLSASVVLELKNVMDGQILGYIKSETLVSCSAEELRQGNVPNSQALSRISPVFNSLEETLTYDFDANVEDDRLES